MKNHFLIIFLLVFLASCNTDTKTESNTKAENNATKKTDASEIKIIEGFKALPDSKKSFLDFVLGSSMADCKTLCKYYISSGIFTEKNGGVFYQILSLDSDTINLRVSLKSLNDNDLTSIELELVDSDTILMRSIYNAFNDTSIEPKSEVVSRIVDVISLYSEKYGNPSKQRASKFHILEKKKILLNAGVFTHTSASGTNVFIPSGYTSNNIREEPPFEVIPEYDFFKWTTNDKIISFQCLDVVEDRYVIVKDEYKKLYNKYSRNDPKWYRYVDIVIGYKKAIIIYTNEKFEKIKNQRLNYENQILEQNKTRNLEQENQNKKNKIESALNKI